MHYFRFPVPSLLGFRIHVSAFEVQVSVTLHFRFCVSRCKPRISGFPFPVPHLGFLVPELPILISPLGCHVSDFVFQASALGIQPSHRFDFHMVPITGICPIPFHVSCLGFPVSAFLVLVIDFRFQRPSEP